MIQVCTAAVAEARSVSCINSRHGRCSGQKTCVKHSMSASNPFRQLVARCGRCSRQMRPDSALACDPAPFRSAWAPAAALACPAADAFNWCPVPQGGADALLLLGLAVLISCAVYSRLSAVSPGPAAAPTPLHAPCTLPPPGPTRPGEPRRPQIWVLIAGAVFEVAAYNLNLGHFSNAATLWLGMKPATSE